jgi:hypothetical protein
MRSDIPIPIEARALGTLDYIRSSIDASAALVVPGTAGVLMGSIGVLAAIVASTPLGSAHWLAIWLVACIAAFLVGAAVMAREASQTGHARYLGPARKFLLCLSPALLAGAVLTVVLAHAGMENLLPGTWLLLYGCAVLSASTVTVARTRTLIASMGAVFVVLGCVAFALPAVDRTAILGLGFGVLHFVCGVRIAQLSGHG